MKPRNIFFIAVITVFVIGLILINYKQQRTANQSANSNQNTNIASNEDIQNNSNNNFSNIRDNSDAATATTNNQFSSPIDNSQSRISKKFFGTYVTPQNSPVSPERFTGYHTGLDFETTTDEKDMDITINALCNGKLLVKGRASGYGGYAVQSCTLNNQSVTIVYGHLRESSITPKVGDNLKAGQSIAVLGTGNSSETDGERKHLHLSIHIGTTVNIKGYVQNKSELSGWIDPKTILSL